MLSINVSTLAGEWTRRADGTDCVRDHSRKSALSKHKRDWPELLVTLTANLGCTRRRGIACCVRTWHQYSYRCRGFVMKTARPDKTNICKNVCVSKFMAEKEIARVIIKLKTTTSLCVCVCWYVSMVITIYATDIKCGRLQLHVLPWICINFPPAINGWGFQMLSGFSIKPTKTVWYQFAWKFQGIIGIFIARELLLIGI